MSEPTRRPATAADWPAAWAVQRAAFAELVARTHGGWTPELERGCAAAWDPATTTLVELDGHLVGWTRSVSHPDHDWLDLVVLDPAVQGRGLGTWLLRDLLARAAARGVPLWLSVWRVNRARALYVRLGFDARPRDVDRVWMVHPASTPGAAPPEPTARI